MFHRSKTGAVDVIRAEVPLIEAACEGLTKALSTALLVGRPMAVLDLSRVDLIDSCGLETILDQFDSFAEVGGELKLAAANPLCHDILRVTGVSDTIAVYDSVKSAVSSFAK